MGLLITRARYESVVDAVEEVVGDDLRGVAVVSEEAGGVPEDLLSLRDDVASTYSDEEIDRIESEMLFELWNHEWQGEIFDAGDMAYVLHRFEQATLVMCDRGDYGVVVSVDADATLDVDRVVHAVCAELDDA